MKKYGKKVYDRGHFSSRRRRRVQAKFNNPLVLIHKVCEHLEVANVEIFGKSLSLLGARNGFPLLPIRRASFRVNLRRGIIKMSPERSDVDRT